MSRFYTVKEAAEYLGIKDSTLYSWAGKGAIPSYRFGRLVRFKREDLEAWAEAQRSNISERQSYIPTATSSGDKTIEQAVESVLSCSQGKARPASLKGGG